jgi:hypothetical protein
MAVIDVPSGVDGLDMDTIYTVVSFQYLIYANMGNIIFIEVTKSGDANTYRLMLTEGGLFDKVEKIHSKYSETHNASDLTSFTFKRESITFNSNATNYVVITGDNSRNNLT